MPWPGRLAAYDCTDFRGLYQSRQEENPGEEERQQDRAAGRRVRPLVG